MVFYRYNIIFLYVHCESKKQDTNSCLYLPQMLTDFQNSVTDRLSSKFAIKSSKYPTTPDVLLHYLVKCECQKTGGDLKNAVCLMINHKIAQPSI